MAKHCTNCGHELRDTDKFCAECGAGVGGGTAMQSAAVQWEYCEIGQQILKQVGVFSPGQYEFYATAVHPKRGRYNAGDIQWWTGRPEENAKLERDALNELITKLTADGWELIPSRGLEWYSHKLRHQVKG